MTFQPFSHWWSYRKVVNLRVERWLPTCWVDGRGFHPQNSLGFPPRVFPKWNWNWPFGSHLYNFNLGTSQKSFPAIKTATKYAKTSSCRFYTVDSFNKSWWVSSEAQQKVPASKFTHKNQPLQSFPSLDPPWPSRLDHHPPRSLHEVVSDTNLIEELLGSV